VDSHPSVRPTWDSAGSVNVPAWSCTGWGLPSRRVTATLVRSYRTFSPLPATRFTCDPAAWAVVFCGTFPRVSPGRVASTTLALWCPDFPRTRISPRVRDCLTGNNKGRRENGAGYQKRMAKDHGSSVKNDKQYEGLRKKGMSKERAAKISNANAGSGNAASKKGGKKGGKKSGSKS